ncbi:hypothetical protein DSO57_1032230 [Entomophthora muscae]|uniref:Uncharacterized protein n=2 Tax=Entomophthora muscae TaxID=34485 RepID=A0ACC2SPE9_9FUNG|nr:hypothetical protein DSO57_1032225 [Entomophthora muscae]KAJ9064279.1 hypothetical protein DSO57_1032230 [Entomophthora muscae]
MLYLRPEATCYEGLNLVTISKLKDNEIQFTTNSGNVCHWAETGEKTPYIPTTQQGDTILHYHQTLGHIRGRVVLGVWGGLISVIGHRVLGLDTVICEDIISIVAEEHMGRGINNYFGGLASDHAEALV